MTHHQKIWELLRENESITIKEASKKLDIAENSIALYIRALFNANYIEVKTPHSKIKHNHKIVLIKNSGEKSPKLNKNSNVLTDMNDLEEFFITKKGEDEKDIKHHVNLVPTLQAIIKLNKKNIYKKDIWQKAKFDSPSKLSRWLPRLVDVGILKETVERDRNSPMYISDAKEAERLLKLVLDFKSHRLAFEVFKNQ